MLGIVVATAVDLPSYISLNIARACDSFWGFSNVICKSDPTVASTVLSSTKVPVYP